MCNGEHFDAQSLVNLISLFCGSLLQVSSVGLFSYIQRPLFIFFCIFYLILFLFYFYSISILFLGMMCLVCDGENIDKLHAASTPMI